MLLICHPFTLHTNPSTPNLSPLFCVFTSLQTANAIVFRSHPPRQHDVTNGFALVFAPTLENSHSRPPST